MNASKFRYIYRIWWLWAILAVIFLIIIIPGKSRNSDLSQVINNKNTKVYKSSDDIKVGDLHIDILDIANLKEVKINSGTEKTNSNFLVLKLSILNTGKIPKKITDSMFRVRIKDGSTYNIDTNISSNIKDNEGFLTKLLNPRIYTTGFLVFEVPNTSDKEQYYLQISDDKLLGEAALININRK